MEMEKKKKDYEAPDIKVTQVEIESSICNGSVEFKGSDTGVGQIDIASQEVEIQYKDGNSGPVMNDFSNDFWPTQTGTN